MLLLLPRDLSVHLLNDWLEGTSLLTLSALDVAFCNHAGRKYWLEMLTYARVQEDTTRKPFNKYLAWLKKRKVQLECLLVDMKAVGPLTKANQHLVLPHVTKMTFLADSFRSKPIAFLSCFPSLTELGFNRCDQLSDTRLLEVCAQPLPLKKLILANCTQISPDLVAHLAISLSATLEVLYCDVLDDAAVLQLAQHCPRLNGIAWMCDSAVLSEDSLAVFCCSKPALRYLHLHNNADADMSPVTNELVEQISVHCKQLEDVDLLDNGLVTAAALRPLISNCGKLWVVSLCQVQVELDCCEDGQRTGSLLCLDHITAEELCEILTAIAGLVSLDTLMSAHGEVISISTQALELLARHGHTLNSVRLDFIDAPIEQQDVRHFLEHCPQLVTLCMTNYTQIELLPNELVAALPRLCPHLASLGIYFSAVMTDHAIGQALQGFPRNQLTGLALTACPQLTDATLAAIATSCPRSLTRLVLSLDESVGMTKTGLLECILHLPCLQEVSSGSKEINRWIERELIKRGVSRALEFCYNMRGRSY